MPADKKNEMVQNLHTYLAETIINSGDDIYAPSSLVADYSVVMAGYDDFVVYCRDEILTVGVGHISSYSKNPYNYS